MILGIGCDIVEIKRIEVALQKDHVNRILTPKEQACCEDMPFLRKAEWVAGRFAAKEAIYKAIHAIHACTLCDIEILSDDDGAPYCTMEEYAIQVSIAHEKAYAIAYAIVESKEIDD